VDVIVLEVAPGRLVEANADKAGSVTRAEDRSVGGPEGQEVMDWTETNACAGHEWRLLNHLTT